MVGLKLALEVRIMGATEKAKAHDDTKGVVDGPQDVQLPQGIAVKQLEDHKQIVNPDIRPGFTPTKGPEDVAKWFKNPIENGADHGLSKDDLRGAAKNYWDNVLKGPFLSDSGKKETEESAKAFKESIEKLTPADLKEIGGLVKSMREFDAKLDPNNKNDEFRYKAVEKTINEIAKTIREKYGSDPEKQESMVNGLMMAVKSSGLDNWSLRQSYEYGNGNPKARYFDISYNGMGFPNKLTPDKPQSVEKAFQDNKDGIVGPVNDLAKLYDKTYFTPAEVGGNSDAHKADFEKYMTQVLPGIEKAYNE